MVNGNYLKWATVRSERPQGSAIGTMFFIIFMKSMFNCVCPNLYLYAIDAGVHHAVVTDEDAAQLQKHFIAPFDWTQDGPLQIHFVKVSQVSVEKIQTNNEKLHKRQL